MTAEAAFSVTVKSVKGDLHTLRGDSWAEFCGNAEAMLGAYAETFLAGVRQTFGGQAAPVNAPQSVPDEAQALQNVQQQFPGSTVSTVGQPLPQPGAAAPAATAGPGEPQAGELREINGEIKKWIPAGVSKAGKAYKGFWGKP